MFNIMGGYRTLNSLAEKKGYTENKVLVDIYMDVRNISPPVQKKYLLFVLLGDYIIKYYVYLHWI